MLTLSKTRNKNLIFLAVVACLAMSTMAAYAISPDQVLRVMSNRDIKGKCCFTWNETVAVIEPAKLQPVVVTWSTDYQLHGRAFYTGLSVNGGPCGFYGSGSSRGFSPGNGTFRPTSFQWVVKPSDGLVQGTNTLTLCGGDAPFNPGAILTVGYRTLAAQLGK